MTDKVQKIRKEVKRLQNELIQEKEKGFGSDADDACILELQNVLTYIDSLQEEPVSENLFEASAEYAATGEILANGKEMIDFQKQKDFIAGAEWQKAKLPKWKKKPLGGGCWSGEISVDPIRRSYRYEHYIINADKLFKLLDKEE